MENKQNDIGFAAGYHLIPTGFVFGWFWYGYSLNYAIAFCMTYYCGAYLEYLRNVKEIKNGKS
jgi:amino acid permease